MTMLPVPLTVPPVTRLPGSFADRHRLARHHRLVDGGSSLERRRRPPESFRRDARAAWSPTWTSAIGTSFSIRPSTRRAVFGARPSSPLSAGRRPAARADLQDLTEQHERGDDDGRVEVRLDAAVHPEAVGKQARRDRRDDAVGVGGADPGADQREHVGAAIDERVPGAREERPAGPQHDRASRAASWIQFGSADVDGAVDRAGRDHLRHREHHHRQTEHGRDHEAAGHVDQLDVGPLVERDHRRLERHAAERAGARSLLPHLRVHRAGVDGVRISAIASAARASVGAR